MPISMKREDKGDITTLSFSEVTKLDFENSVWLRGELHGLLKEDRTRIILDLSTILKISSYAIRVLIEFVRDLKKRGGDLKFLNLRPGVSKTFEATRINCVLDIFQDEDETTAKDQAITAFEAPTACSKSDML